MNRKTFLSITSVGLIVGAVALFECRTDTTSAHVPGIPQAAHSPYNVKTFGARGDGTTLDTPAVNKAIETAAAAGGGTVYFPAGTYLCLSIHLQSNISLYLDQGATILAADPKEVGVWYDDTGKGAVKIEIRATRWIAELRPNGFGKQILLGLFYP